VAGGTGGGPASGGVIRIRGAVEVGGVAGVARSGCSGKDIIDVAFNTIDRCVRAGEREGRVVVVKGGASPRGSSVAGIAGCREARGRVIWIGRAVPVGLMASIARGRQCCVVVAGVALRTCQGGMCASKRKCGVVVIER